jgi:hypothetical protein
MGHRRLDISKAMTGFQLRSMNLNRWQRAWCIAACLWLVVCVLIIGYNFPTDARLRAAWTAASYETLSRDRATIDAADAECENLTSASDYAASLRCIDVVLHMKYAYQDRLNGLIQYGVERAEKERLSDQIFTVAEGIVLWAVPSFGLYLIGPGIRWATSRINKPAYRPSEPMGTGDVFRWPDRTRRKRRSGR